MHVFVCACGGVRCHVCAWMWGCKGDCESLFLFLFSPRVYQGCHLQRNKSRIFIGISPCPRSVSNTAPVSQLTLAIANAASVRSIDRATATAIAMHG
jgi:hypothetical protein